MPGYAIAPAAKPGEQTRPCLQEDEGFSCVQRGGRDGTVPSFLGQVVLATAALHLASLGKNTVPAMKRSCLRQCERCLVRGLLQRAARRCF